MRRGFGYCDADYRAIANGDRCVGAFAHTDTDGLTDLYSDRDSVSYSSSDRDGGA